MWSAVEYSQYCVWSEERQKAEERFPVCKDLGLAKLNLVVFMKVERCKILISRLCRYFKYFILQCCILVGMNCYILRLHKFEIN